VNAEQIARSVRERQTSAADIARAAIDAIGRDEPRLHAYLDIFADAAITQARAIDERLSRGEGGSLPLAGVPIAIKDNICVAHGRTTCASRFLENYVSPFSATTVQRLVDAGAVIVGKTNLDEFGMGSSTENSAFGPTRNPWDVSRVPGGSSGGSAATVAAGGAAIALGSDTGGSIRQPASHCGIVGLKPTYGRVSRWGLVAYASSLDQIGPMTRTVRDAALVLGVIAGFDPLDSTSMDRDRVERHGAPGQAAGETASASEPMSPPFDRFLRGIETPIDGLVVGVPRQARAAGNHRAVAATLDRTIETYARLGARVIDIDLPTSDHAIAAYYIVAAAEASSNLARFDGIRFGRRAELAPGEGLIDLYRRSRSEGFGPEVRRRIMLGTHGLSSGYYDAYYTTALKARRAIKGDFDRAFAECHAILMPASPGPAFKLGEKTADPMAMYLEDVYTVGVNLAGLPAITVPAGFADDPGARLPIGMQLVGPAWSEATLLRVARMFERENAIDFAPPR
jgi:aspartyl-tRNA(Asn)/glutamyl-tRNA(Gln) amidotransferase subunit A